MMITIVAAGLALVTLGDAQPDLKSVADRLHSTVVVVRAIAPVAVGADNSNDVLGTATLGTGVLVGDGVIVTTLHTIGVVLPGRVSAWSNIEALIQDEGSFAAEVVAWFPEVDLAILRISLTAPVARVPFAGDPPERGDRLLVMGAGEDTVNAVGAVVAGVAGDLIFMASTHAIDSRSWGGPVLDAKGQLAGISLPSTTTPRALTSAAVRRLLDRVRVDREGTPPAVGAADRVHARHMARERDFVAHVNLNHP